MFIQGKDGRKTKRTITTYHLHHLYDTVEEDGITSNHHKTYPNQTKKTPQQVRDSLDSEVLCSFVFMLFMYYVFCVFSMLSWYSLALFTFVVIFLLYLLVKRFEHQESALQIKCIMIICQLCVVQTI